MKRIEQMINHIRKATDNSQKNTMTDDVLVQFMNDAANRAQSLIFQANPECRAFDVMGYKTFVPLESKYALDTVEDENGVSAPSLIYTTGSVSMVERSDNTPAGAYYRVKLIGATERLIGMGYVLLRNNILIFPPPQNGKMRITYTKKLTPVDIRRGKVSVVTPGVSLTITGVPTKTDFADIDYICVVDKDGNIIRPNIAINSFNSGTGVIATTDLLTSITTDHYVCYGKYATTSPIGNGDPALDDTLERYLNEYVIMRVFMMDSSKDISAQAQLVQTIEAEIESLYRDNNGDAQCIPILTTDYLTI